MDEADLSITLRREAFHSWSEHRAGDAPIRFVETHVSILALTEDRVWKLKKAVRFPFVDLSTVDLRRRNAEREVALNRRFAPDVYLGIVALDDEPALRGEVVVEMRRMPEDRRLSVVAARSREGARSCVDRIADELARVHRTAPRRAEIDRAGLRDNLVDLWSCSLDEMRPFAPAVLDPAELVRVAADAQSYAAGRDGLFSQRIADGHILDGHGDLLADDVFCLDDGPRFLDCLEFDDALRYGDALADVAFLVMDLERLGHHVLAANLLEAYRRSSGDSWPSSLADFYVAYRALVRSKIACLGAGPIDSEAAWTARSLLALAGEHLAHGRVRLVLIGGPPGTGKTLAREVGMRTGWSVVHSDEVRKRLAGLAPTTSAADELDSGLYTPQWSARTYDALFDIARPRLAGGQTVILDASWSDVRRRDDAERLAASTSSVLTGFVLSAPDDVADARARARWSARADASDASTPVTAPLRARFTPWADAIALDATRPSELMTSSVLDHVGYPD